MPPVQRKPRPHTGQLGLNFFDLPEPEAAPQAPPAAKKPTRPPEASEESLAAMAAAGWSAPTPIIAASGHASSNALALACAARDASLVEMLLGLPISWSLNGRYAANASAERMNLTPMAHLLNGQGANTRPAARPSSMTATEVALAMIFRGASFIQESDDGQSPLGIAVSNGNEPFISALAGHPDFDHAILGNMRVGSTPKPDQETSVDASKPELDSRQPILASLISRNLMKGAEALIIQADFPINEPTPSGRLPIGYAPNPEALDLLLSWGADPSLRDARGLNAMSHVQRIPDTGTREKMITILATKMRKNAATNPDALAELQRENLPALLNAAGTSTKSSLLKILSAFKFVAADARDPKTLLTPLMAALHGGKLASAKHLIDLGCRINDANTNGVTASAYLLGAIQSPNGPSVNELISLVKNDIDLGARSKRGWPVPLEGAFCMAKNPAENSYNSTPIEVAKRIESLLMLAAPAERAALVVGPKGETLAEAYVAAKPKSSYRHKVITELYLLNAAAGTPENLDRTIASLIRSYVGNSGYSYSNQSTFATAMDLMASALNANPVPLGNTAAVMALGPDVIPEIAAIKELIAKNYPGITSGVETFEIEQTLGASDGLSAPRRGPRL